jgi:hypothetical protein
MAAWLTQKDADDYGYDVLDLAQRAAKHAVAPDLARLEQQNEALGRQLAQEQRRGLYQTLDAQIPDWRQIDSDPRWRQWLAQPYELSGHTRQAWLNDAMAKGDAARVASFFRGFLREAPQGQQPQQVSSAPTGVRTYTRDDIKRASADYLRGRIPQSAYERLSNDMHRAIAEGRIVGPMPMRGIGKTRV